MRERARDARMVREQLRARLLRRELEHVADGEAEVAHLERARLEALAVARGAGRDDVRQEAHLVRDRRPDPRTSGSARRCVVLKEKRDALKPATCASGVAAKSWRMTSQMPRNVAGTERGVRPMGDWSTATARASDSNPVSESCAPGSVGHEPELLAAAPATAPAARACSCRSRSRRPPPMNRPSGTPQLARRFRLCARAPSRARATALVALERRGGHAARGGADERATGRRIGAGQHLAGVPLGHDAPAVSAAARTEIDQVVGRADRVRVVLDHHHRGPDVHQAAADCRAGGRCRAGAGRWSARRARRARR